jgi:hypothetical protein
MSNGDVAAAANFARDNNLRLVVKGAGHEGLWKKLTRSGDVVRLSLMFGPPRF